METTQKVCVLAYDGLCTFEYSIAVEIFGLARPEIENWYECEIVAAEPGSLRGLGHVVIETDLGLEALEDADTIIIPGWRGADEPIPGPLKQALIKANAAGKRIASICSGVFVLAQCGLLDGAKVTTHWRYVDELREKFPDTFVDPNVLFVEHGNIITSAGSAAGIDMCLHLIRADFGRAVTNSVARRLVIPAFREGGQAQYISHPVAKYAEGSIAPIMDEIREKLDFEWDIDSLAKLANTSPRTLQRRFKDATGHSPHAWLTLERIELVKDLLETTNLNIQQIANVAGLKTPETLRHHFKRIAGTSPTTYRSKFNPHKEDTA
ncbi:MAG TPA: transcriptional regulator FtrA [Hellea balneolensis]|uniref:Transcriptional regulator FtrA n=1 Tax=Hellea balneolensis TaxID=287478 RepID=A0A7C5LS05_9PROT|nr:transcriptional regulator FtrA [Hellea balneolensis]